MPKQTDQDQQPVMGTLTVVENTFHDKQTIPLYMGDNVIGHVQEDKNGKLRFILRDAPSNTGTFYQNEILKDVDRVEMHDQTIITIGATTLIVNIPE